MKPVQQLVSMVERCVLITGAASGIGQAMALRFAEAGADLVLVDYNADNLNRTTDKVSSYPGKVTTSVLDLADKPAIDDFWTNLTADPDILINNAGIYPMLDFLKVDTAFLAQTLQVNLESVFWMSQHFIRQRDTSGGVIINVSSVEALLPFKENMVPYSVSKAGVLALTRALARDYGKQGFRVNALIPGAIKTPGTQSLIKRALTTFNWDLVKTGYDFQNRLALGRWGHPDEVAKVALFLASDLASYIQGALIPVDGGFLSS